MPHDNPDATDPMTLHGVIVETNNDEAMRDMAACFVEEYIRSGFDADRILKMFKTQGYAGPFLAYQTLGEDAICRIINDLMTLWGRSGRTVQLPSSSSTFKQISLPVIES